MNYGSTRFRVSDSSPDVSCVAGIVVAVSPEHARGDGVLQALDLATGRTYRAEPVAAHAIAGRRVVAAILAKRGLLRTYALPSLESEGEVSLGAEIRALAARPEIVAAALPDGVALVRGAEVRKVAVASPTSLAFSPDGAWLAVGTEAGRVAVVDVRTGAVARTLIGARVSIASLAWSGDASLLAAAGGKSAVVWPAAGGKVRSLYKVKRFASIVGFHGRSVLVHGIQEVLAAVDAETLAVVWKVTQYGPARLAGDRVLAVRFDDLREIDAGTGAITRSMIAPHIHVHSVDVDGDTIVLGLSTGSRLAVGDLASGAWEPTPDGHEAEVLCVGFAGELFATGGRDNRAIVWRRGQEAPLLSVVTPEASRTEQVNTVRIEGDSLWVGMGDRVRRYRIADGKDEASGTLEHDVQVIVPVGGVILACAEATRRTYGELVLLDPVTLATLHTERLSRSFTHGVVSGGRVRLFAGHGWAVYDVTARAFVEEGELSSESFSNVDPIHVSADQRLLVEIDTQRAADGEGWRGVFRSFDVRQDRLLVEQETVELSGTGDLDAAGARLATCHTDGRVRVWEARTGALLQEIEDPAGCTDVRWFPDGSALLGWSEAGALVEIPAPRRDGSPTTSARAPTSAG